MQNTRAGTSGHLGRTRRTGRTSPVRTQIFFPDVCDKKGRRGRRGVLEKVKWLGVILDEDLDFGPYWKYKLGKARSLLGALHGVGTSR